MAKVKVYNMQGKVVGEEKLEPRIFEMEAKPQLIQLAVKTQLANARLPLAHVKTKAEVRGGGKKPWRQKGTGRARAGSIRSPLWRGGGKSFGPRKERNFKLKINKQAKRKALFMTLSDKVKNKKIILLDKLEMPKIKTKDFLKILSKLPVSKTILTILPASDKNIIRSARNLPYIKTILADSLNVVDVLGHEYLLIPKNSLEIISKTYLK